MATIRAEKAKRQSAKSLAELVSHAQAVRFRCQTFSGFVREAWHVLEPNNPLKWSWHLDAMCDHLQAVTEGRLSPWGIINVPPGSSKSMIVTVLWQAWEWGPMGLPATRYLTSSFELENVKRDTRKTRDLVRSEWYQTLWPAVVMSRAGETSFANSDTGTREGVPFGSITGKRGDRLIIDDPHSLQGAESPTQREEAVRLFLEGGLNRLNDQTKSSIIVVMQRLHEMDLTGALLAHDLGFWHLMIPMEAELDRVRPTPLGWVDPRTYDGELMDPVRMPRAAVEKLKNVSAYSWAGQYQQRPAPREGGLFKRGWFEIVGSAPATAKRTRAWDLAASTGTTSAYTAGVKVARDREGTFYVEHVERFRGGPQEVENTIKALAMTDGKQVAVRLPQDPGQAGKVQALTLIRMLAGWDVKATPVTGSKEARATPAAAQAEGRNVKIVEGPWNEAFLQELCGFPSFEYKDQVDAFADALNDLALAPRGATVIGKAAFGAR